MATINVKDAAGATVALEKPLIPGQAVMASSRPVVLASDQSAIPVASHAVTNAGTFSVQISNANANGQATMANSAPVVIASNQASIPVASTLTAETTKVIGTVNISAAQNTTPVDQYGQYETAAASATTVFGATGATGDYLAYLIVFPGTAGCGTLVVKDGSNTWGTFAGGGTTALPSLVPFRIDVGAFSTAGAWSGVLGANITAVGVGKFT